MPQDVGVVPLQKLCDPGCKVRGGIVTVEDPVVGVPKSRASVMHRVPHFLHDIQINQCINSSAIGHILMEHNTLRIKEDDEH